jgi:hypothetical protein
LTFRVTRAAATLSVRYLLCECRATAAVPTNSALRISCSSNRIICSAASYFLGPTNPEAAFGLLLGRGTTRIREPMKVLFLIQLPVTITGALESLCGCSFDLLSPDTVTGALESLSGALSIYFFRHCRETT